MADAREKSFDKGEKKTMVKKQDLPQKKKGITRKDSDKPMLSVGDVLTRFCDRTSMHGCGYIESSRHRASRLLWAALTLTAVAVLIFHLYDISSEFFSWLKTTSVSLGFNNLMLPAITLCNVNVLKESSISGMQADTLSKLIKSLDPANMKDDEDEEKEENTAASPTTSTRRSRTTTAHTASRVRKKRFAKRRLLNVTAFDTDMDETEVEEDEEETMQTKKDTNAQIEQLIQYLYMNLSRKERKEGGHQINDMLLHCVFNGRECYAENFTLYQTSTYGNCFTLESQRLVSRSPGPEGGLSLVLYLQTSEYLRGVTNGYGTRLVLHNRGTNPQPHIEGIFVSAATETNIALRQTSISRLGFPYGYCNDGKEFYETYGLLYNREVCHTMCEMNYIKDACGCFHYIYEEFTDRKNISMCKRKRERKCVNVVLEQLKQKKLRCKCDNPCNEVLYSKTISSRQWPTTAFAELLQSDVCEDEAECVKLKQERDVRKDFVKINIYYESLNYAQLSEHPKITTFAFMSSIGGALGLWIGLSLLGFCEILQLIGELTRSLLYSRWTQVRP